MKKQIFKANKPSIKNYQKYARVDGNMYSYIDGYYEASKSLVEVAITENSPHTRNILFYPICYSYRHYLELHIKSLITDVEKCCLEFDDCSNPLQKVGNSLNNTHNLNELLELFIERFNAFSSEGFPDDIKKYIKQIHDTDKNGQKYRYYKGTNKKLSFPDEQEFDLKNISDIMEEVHNLLIGIDGYINDCIEYYEEMSHEYEQMMRSEV